MELGHHPGVDWKDFFARRGFRYFFAGIFISLCGSGMNFAGVAWYILARTNSTVQVSFLLILWTLPGIIVPFAGGVLIDRVDRRYLGMTLDLARGVMVGATAALVNFGRGGLVPVYAMIVCLGIGSAIYWSTVNALVQEVIPSGRLVAANSAVLIAVQGGLAIAGAFVGFTYDHAGIAGILAIDATSYFGSAFCLFRLRRGYFPPRIYRADELPAGLEAPLAAAEETALAPLIEPSPESGFLTEMREGFRYLRERPAVLAIGLTYSCMVAGVISGNVVDVAMVKNILHAGARGYGFMEMSWAVGAVAGGFAAGWLALRFRPTAVLLAALMTLAVGHVVMPHARFLIAALALQLSFGASRALGGVLTQSAIMTAVPRRLMGRTQSAFAMISTTLAMAMTFSLGWLAERVSLPFAFLVLAAIYAIAVAAAIRARALTQAAAPAEQAV